MRVRTKQAADDASAMLAVLSDRGFHAVGEVTRHGPLAADTARTPWQSVYEEDVRRVVLTNLEASQDARMIEAELYDPRFTPDVRVTRRPDRLAALLDREPS